MKNISKVMVCLDLTKMDDFLVQYGFYISSLFESAYKTYFVHNIKFDYPEEAQELIDSLDKPLSEVVTEIIYEKVKEEAAQTSSNLSFEISVSEEGSTASALADFAKEEEIDLIIAGKKISHQGTGIVIDKLLTMSSLKASLLMMPETAYHQINNILVPTDFSKASSNALSMGLYLRKQTGAEIDCQHVYNIPAHYFPYIPTNDLREKMQKSAEKEWKEFKAKLKMKGAEGLTCSLTYDSEKSVAESIYNYALKTKKDLIIVSSKGKGAITSFVLGSVATRLVKQDWHIPLMITRP